MLYFSLLILSIASCVSYFLFSDKKKSVLFIVSSIIFFVIYLVHSYNPYNVPPFLYEKISGYVEDKYVAIDSSNNNKYVILLRVKSFEKDKEIIRKIKVKKIIYETVEKNKIQHLPINERPLYILFNIVCGGLLIVTFSHYLASIE